MGTYSHGLRIEGIESVADIVNGEQCGTLRVLDLAGPGIFVDSSIPVGLIVGVTALNNDERLKESLSFQGRDFNQNRKIVEGNIFRDSTWDTIAGISNEFDLICFKPGRGMDPDGYMDLDGVAYSKSSLDYDQLKSIDKSINDEYLRLYIRSYNLLSRGGMFFGKLIGEGLRSEGLYGYYNYVDMVFGALGIGYVREGCKIAFMKGEVSPVSIDESILQLNLFGCMCEPGCDLRGIRTPEGLRKVLFKRAPVMGKEPGFASQRRNRRTGRATSIWMAEDGKVQGKCETE